MSETKVILKYKRECDSWLCPECDTENSISLDKCAVCNFRKTSEVAILKQWSAVDEHAVSTTSTTKTKKSTSIFKDDDYTPPTEANKNKIIWGIIIVILIVGLLVAASQGSTYATYSDAINEFNSGNYETAMAMFEDLPSSYKDVSYMLVESKYQCATKYLNAGDFASAESLFESIAYHNDSADKLNECKYQSAYALYNSGSYAEAKNIFQELSPYSDSDEMVSECKYQVAYDLFNSRNYNVAKRNFQEITLYKNSAEMVNECDYIIASNYKDDGDYVKAMKAFKELGGYKDSRSQFSDSENLLVFYNESNGYYGNEFSMVGEWSDSSGNYVAYTSNGNGSLNASYNLGYTEGQLYKVLNGIHYHGDDYSGWKKQWIYQRVDNNTVQAYDYIDGQIYNLTRK